ncbi:MAG TPA: hypothetical protein VH538_01445 [Gaiellaceae bacterium]|jgi:hypothetical protein
MSTTLRILVVAAAIASAAAVAGTARAADWFWSPGLCKSRLHQFGMQINDGRTFGVEQSFCIGRGGTVHCEWTSASHVKRLYDRFLVIARSSDGVVRRFDLIPTGKLNYRATGIKSLGHADSAARFNTIVVRLATVAAQTEQQKGCAPPSP